MATDRKLSIALLKRLGVTPGRLSQRVKKMKNDRGPMSTEDATYVIAHLEGLDLTKFLDGKIVDRIRGLVPNNTTTPSPPSKSAKKKIPRTPQIRINIPGQLPQVDALLSAAIARDAAKMAELYPAYYVLENSIRVFIKRILEHKHGKNWWSTKAPRDVRNKVSGRKASEDKKPWHGKRGQHEIFYSDFGDLRAIIEKNWPNFKDLISKRNWITHLLDDLEHPRNVMAHHNPVTAQDIKRFEVHFHDWMEFLKSKKDVIP